MAPCKSGRNIPNGRELMRPCWAAWQGGAPSIQGTLSMMRCKPGCCYAPLRLRYIPCGFCDPSRSHGSKLSHCGGLAARVKLAPAQLWVNYRLW